MLALAPLRHENKRCLHRMHRLASSKAAMVADAIHGAALCFDLRRFVRSWLFATLRLLPLRTGVHWHCCRRYERIRKGGSASKASRTQSARRLSRSWAACRYCIVFSRSLRPLWTDLAVNRHAFSCAEAARTHARTHARTQLAVAVCSSWMPPVCPASSCAWLALQRGSLQRTTAATLMNDRSSRSHAIFTLTLEQASHRPSARAACIHASPNAALPLRPRQDRVSCGIGRIASAAPGSA